MSCAEVDLPLVERPEMKSEVITLLSDDTPIVAEERARPTSRTHRPIR